MVLSPLQSGSFNFVSDSFQHDNYRVDFALRLLKLFLGGVQPPQCEISSKKLHYNRALYSVNTQERTRAAGEKINVAAENAVGHPITPNRGRDDEPAANVTTTPNKAVDREPPTSLESTRREESEVVPMNHRLSKTCNLQPEEDTNPMEYSRVSTEARDAFSSVSYYLFCRQFECLNDMRRNSGALRYEEWHVSLPGFPE
ncbi:unnamed protein product [Fusarium fujikuroi]|nr:Uncharacterized protein Y057_8483 [Fusarium fujikuroi]VTT73106.1 unnamed protein product [Fusarium fujikuroi]